MYKSTVLALYNNNYNIYSFVIKMLSQISQHNRKHVTHEMGVFVMIVYSSYTVNLVQLQSSTTEPWWLHSVLS